MKNIFRRSSSRMLTSSSRMLSVSTWSQCHCEGAGEKCMYDERCTLGDDPFGGNGCNAGGK